MSERYADPNDLSSQRELEFLEEGLTLQRKKAALGLHPGPDFSECVACGDEIEPVRVQHQMARCLECQVSYEKKSKQFNR